MLKNLPADAGDAGSIPGSGRCPGEGNGNLTPVFLPGKPHGWKSLAATVHGVTIVSHNIETNPPCTP